MRRTAFLIFVLVIWLATCSGPVPEIAAPELAPTQTATAVPPSATPTPFPPTLTPTSPPMSKLPAAPFEAQTYVNEEAGFALDYPIDWTVSETVVGPRGTQILFLSTPELAEAATIPEDQVRLSATIYQWDPKNDLAAYVDNLKSAWSASGFTILDEQELTLELGLPAVQFTVETPDTQVVYLVTALEDQYLVLAGEGDLALVEQIVQRLRPISS